MSDKAYNVLNYIAQVTLPSIGSLYYALEGIWGLPYAEQVVGTITAVDAFIGVILRVSYKQKMIQNQTNIIGKQE